MSRLAMLNFACVCISHIGSDPGPRVRAPESTHPALSGAASSYGHSGARI